MYLESNGYTYNVIMNTVTVSIDRLRRRGQITVAPPGDLLIRFVFIEVLATAVFFFSAFIMVFYYYYVNTIKAVNVGCIIILTGIP